MMPTPEEEEAAERAAHPPPPTATVIPPGVDGGVDAGPPQYVNPSTFVPVLATEALDGGLSRTPDSVAAQLVTDGHLEDALVQYEALRLAHPERPEYGVMCEVLRRQLMSRCVNDLGSVRLMLTRFNCTPSSFSKRNTSASSGVAVTSTVYSGRNVRR